MCHSCRVHRRAISRTCVEKIDVTYLANPSNLLEKVVSAKGKQSRMMIRMYGHHQNDAQAAPFSLFIFFPSLFFQDLLSLVISIITIHGREKNTSVQTESDEKLARRQRVRVEGRRKSE